MATSKPKPAVAAEGTAPQMSEPVPEPGASNTAQAVTEPRTYLTYSLEHLEGLAARVAAGYAMASMPTHDIAAKSVRVAHEIMLLTRYAPAPTSDPDESSAEG